MRSGKWSRRRLVLAVPAVLVALLWIGLLVRSRIGAEPTQVPFSDLLSALDSWVTGKATPATLTAQKLDPVSGAVQFERPLCQYPKYPRYTGPANDAAAAKLASNYSCS